jgi:hypothetical protein
MACSSLSSLCEARRVGADMIWTTWVMIRLLCIQYDVLLMPENFMIHQENCYLRGRRLRGSLKYVLDILFRGPVSKVLYVLRPANKVAEIVGEIVASIDTKRC